MSPSSAEILQRQMRSNSLNSVRREEISQLVFSGKYIDAIYEEKKKASERKKAQKETSERSKLEIISKPLCQLSEETQEPSPKKSPSLSDHREKPKEALVPELPKHHSSDQQCRWAQGRCH